MNRLLFSVLITVLVVGCATAKLTGEDYVLIDKNQVEYTVYVGIPKAKLEEVRAKITSSKKDVTLLTWQDFKQNSEENIKEQIIKDEYPNSKTESGIVELIRKFPGNPIGLTWNGGIAITYNDYQHTKRIYAQYKNDPHAYDEERIKNKKFDPIDPKGHLGPLLGW